MLTQREYDPDPTQYEPYQWVQPDPQDIYEPGQWAKDRPQAERVNPNDALRLINGTTGDTPMAEIPTILVTSKGVDGPYKINEEDFDEKIHTKVSDRVEAKVEAAAERSIEKAEVATAKAEAKAEKDAKK